MDVLFFDRMYSILLEVLYIDGYYLTCPEWLEDSTLELESASGDPGGPIPVLGTGLYVTYRIRIMALNIGRFTHRVIEHNDASVAQRGPF